MKLEADTIRLVATYVIAIVVLVGCFMLLVAPSQLENPEAFVTVIVGVVLGFVFNRESTTAGARAAERSFAKGGESAAQYSGTNGGTRGG